MIVHIIRVLKEGSQLWTEGPLSNPSTEALAPNGLFIQMAFQEGPYDYFQIDVEKTHMESMYTYRECEPETDMMCWHTFYIITDTKGTPWIQLSETEAFLNPILKAHYVDV